MSFFLSLYFFPIYKTHLSRLHIDLLTYFDSSIYPLKSCNLTVIMSIFFLITLLLVSLLNAERLQTQSEDNDDLLIQRSAAASYLCKYSIII
jgi:hypothetical protein